MAVEISDTILNAGASGENIFNNGGTIVSQAYNLSSDDGGGYLTGPDDQINTDPLMGPLQDNGGLTLTHALLLGSPAIDAGDPNFTPPPFFDQRGPGFDRIGRIDIGSFEVQGQLQLLRQHRQRLLQLQLHLLPLRRLHLLRRLLLRQGPHRGPGRRQRFVPRRRGRKNSE